MRLFVSFSFVRLLVSCFAFSFDFFVKLKPCGEITELVEKDYGNGRFCVVNGTYDFNLEEDGKQSVAPARFTFVLERTGVKWMIQSHHSSKQP